MYEVGVVVFVGFNGEWTVVRLVFFGEHFYSQAGCDVL